MIQPTLTSFVRTLCVAGFAAASLPAFAVGAKCPDSGPAANITANFQSGVLRCHRRLQASPACPPSHPVYRIMPEQSGQPARDFCAAANIIMPAPSQRTSINCPPGMNVVDNAGADNRDLCRATGTTQVMPLLIPN